MGCMVKIADKPHNCWEQVPNRYEYFIGSEYQCDCGRVFVLKYVGYEKNWYCKWFKRKRRPCV